MKSVYALLLLVATATAFAPLSRTTTLHESSSTGSSSSPSSTPTVSRTSVITYGLFDFFSQEARDKRAAENERLKDEQEEAQRQILERRLNPDKEADYYAQVVKRRSKFEDLDDGRKVEVVDKKEDSEE